jgi:hypothetical protein
LPAVFRAFGRCERALPPQPEVFRVSDPSPYIAETGMTPAHFRAFQQAAQAEGVVAVVRNTNTASTRLIEMGCPGKPLTIKFNTDATTGVVTASTPADIETARGLGYLVVDQDGVARGQRGQELRLTNTFWRVAPGQVIDARLRKPLVGDYDLMGVFRPSNPRQNIALVASNGRNVRDVSSPVVARFSTRVNASLDMARVMHGAQDQFASFRGSATAFMPDGRAVLLRDALAVETFYNQWGRQTRMGTYNPAPPAPPPPSPPSRPSAPARIGRALVQNGDAMVMIGMALGGLAQSLGDIGIRRQVEREVSTTYANSIQQLLSQGYGVLVIVRLEEWARQDFNGMRARRLVGVNIQAGVTYDAALAAWRQPSFLQGATNGWRMMAEQYTWIPPRGGSPG